MSITQNQVAIQIEKKKTLKTHMENLKVSIAQKQAKSM